MMDILFLGPEANYARLIKAGAFKGHDHGFNDEPIPATPLNPLKFNYQLIVSWGYRYKVPKWALDRAPKHKAINVHIGALPANRGAHPVLWAALDGTRQGVTVHAMDEGIDTGPIWMQSIVGIAPTATFREAHEALMGIAENLIVRSWKGIYYDTYPAPKAQSGEASVHRVADLATVADCLPKSWDTTIEEAKRLHGAKVENDAGWTDEVAEP